MKISIGTPPVEILAIADTGSDLTWTQCKPCVNCFQQSASLFDSNESSTYKTVGCNTEECTSIGTSSCVGGNICEYQMSYGDQSHTIGDLAFDKFTFPSTSGINIDIPNVVFGCGHDNAGTFSNYTSGIIGLGGGEVSIINQLDKEINGKFSYCLVPIPLESSNSNVTSHINFGSSAILSGPNVVSTPLIRKKPSTFYYLNLEGVSIGNKNLKFKSSKMSTPSVVAGDDLGNIIIDSGTTLTLLPNDFYSNLESALVESISATKKDDPSGTFGLCYESENGTIDAPTIIAHFTNADLVLLPSSTFAQVEQGLVCLTIVPAEQIAIFGNLAQANFLIGYDLVANKVSFKPTDCTNNNVVVAVMTMVACSITNYTSGNIIIDSGTTLTYVPNDFYLNLKSTSVDSIVATRVYDPSGNYGLCYKSDENGTIDVPTIVVHFTNADIELSPSNTFAQVEQGFVCLTILPADQIAIFGNLAQDNFLIGYDLVAKKVSFQPTDCTKY
ncbi:hypothetical protein HAX54_017346 [Datura stramonium]|uniref:Peptidase A1 domain-containing protein n=1 Tax=Datura stramonium TaxID=4076 RepID=A0ABS8UM74_DATST|nr:hypothetical protein [Datura stramonium]